MTVLACSDCPLLAELPDLPCSLISLYACELPRTISLPKLSQGLQVLSVGDTGIGLLPDLLPPCLEKLNCWGTPIQQLPEQLPAGLRHLDCDECSSLQRLPAHLPPGLKVITINGCMEITQLPELPAALVEWNCEGCSLRRLPALPPGLQQLDCSDCSSLQQLPDLSGCQLKSLSVQGCVAHEKMRMGGCNVRLI
jgi:E3 ubiquitin-protein ligase SspH2